jgi:hypothetical protein
MDADTIHMIVEWQADFRLKTDGKVGQRTVETLVDELVSIRHFNSAIWLIIEAYNLPTRNLASIRFDNTVTGANGITSGRIGTGQPQNVRVGPLAFFGQATHEETVRAIGHELQHAQQRSGATPIRNPNVREFLAEFWEACETDPGIPVLEPDARVEQAESALRYFDLIGMMTRPTFEPEAERLRDLIKRGGTGPC